MNSPRHSLAALLLCGLLLLIPNTPAHAGSATWNLNPTSGDWNTAANWTPNTVPNGPDDIATFSLSNQTSVSTFADTEVNGISFDPGASAFTIVIPTAALTLGGIGIVNNSNVLQNFANLSDEAGNAGLLRFTGNATAGEWTAYTNEGAIRLKGAVIQFEGNSTAGTAQFVNLGGPGNSNLGGLIEFSGSSTAGNGRFINTADGLHYGYANIEFHDNATAGNGTFTNETNGIYGLGGFIEFFDSTTADRATLTNKSGLFSLLRFHDNSTVGNATIINEGDNWIYRGQTYFFDTSTAGDGLAIANGALVAGTFGNGHVSFSGSSSADNGTFIANGGPVPGANGGDIIITDSSTAENGTFYANGATVDGAFGGRVIFSFGEPTAATATLIATGGVGTGEGEGGGILFHYSSVGDEARVKFFGNGFLDLRAHDPPELTIGSLEGDGLVFLGDDNLSIGSNNLSTRFSGIIEGAPGALTKIGTGSLILTGANTYGGGTTVEGGKLVVSNRDGSGTGSGPVQVNVGRLSGRGPIAGSVTVGTGSGPGAALGPGRRGGKPDALTIQRALTFNSDATYNCGLNTKSAKADQVVANGVTINGAQFALLSRGGLTLQAGTVLTVIDNIAATAMVGTFANLPDGSTFTTHGNTFQVNYEGGDGNDLTLTVVPRININTKTTL